MPNPFFSKQGPSSQTRPDNLKVTKSSLRFGPLEFSRANTVPPMEFGRPGDVVVVDNTDSPSIVLQTNQTPTSVGMWMKLPLGYDIVPAGNVVAGFPAGTSEAGDTLMINSIMVSLSSPYTVASAVVDINAASIPNVTAIEYGESLFVSESTGGALTITDLIGSATVGLGIYSQISLQEFAEQDIVVNGVWMPVGAVASSGGASAPSAASYLTLSADASLTGARTFTAGDGISLDDAGAGGALTVSMDITGAPALSDTLEPTDEILVYNASTGQVEKVAISDLATVSGGVSATEAVQQRNTIMGTAGSYDIGLTIPAGATVRRITLEIASAYSAGTTIEIGDAGSSNRLMTADANDPTDVNTYETTTILDYVAATQVVATIGGSPTMGASRVIVDFIVP